MDRTEWLNRLEALHVSLRDKHPLSAEALAWYRAARASLLETAVEVQGRAVPSDRQPRRSFRVARPVQTLLEAPDWAAQTLTLDLSSGGFGVLLEQPPPFSERISATLLLPGRGPVATPVSVAGTGAVGPLFRVAFRFDEPSEAVRDMLETTLLDDILVQLVFWDDVLGRVRT
jgi:hypothetical protein